MSLSEARTGSLSRAETVLAGLDEEQRTAAQAVSGPVCILAGAGTGKTRTITHRIAYGVHTGRLRARAGAGGDLHRAGGGRAARPAGRPRRRRGAGPHLPRRGACASCATSRPRVLGGPMPSLVENKLRLVATAASRSRLSTDRTSLRDLASEIEWAKTTLATPDDYPARAKAAGREPPFEAAAVAAVYASYESAKQRDGALDFEDLLLVTAYALEEHPAVAGRCAASTGTSSSTSTRTSTRCSSGCSTPGWAAAPRSASSATPTRRSTPSPAPTPTTCSASPTAIPTPAWSSWSATTGPRRRSSALANRLIGQAPRRKGLPGLRLLGQRPDGPEPTLRRAPGRAGRGRRRRGALPGADRRRARRRPRSRCCSASTRSPRSTRRRWPTSGCPYVLKGGERFFERPEVREAVLLLRGAAAGGSEPGALVPDRPRRPGVHGLGRSTGRRRAARPATAGSRWPRWSTSPSTWSPRTRPWTSPASSRTWPSGPTPSTPRPCRA